MNIVTIVGPPNAGKSTLFNRLAGKKTAVVFNKPGVTRDRKEGKAFLGGLEFTITDTGGWDEGIAFSDAIKEQIKKSTDIASVVLLVIDGKFCNDHINNKLASWLLKYTDKPVILTVNKCEGKASETLILPPHKFTDTIYISAEHGLGMMDLYEAIAPFSDDKFKNKKQRRDTTVNVAIVGRPNAGKSTLLNGILNEERVIADSLAGTTRDPIDIEFLYKDRNFMLIDTAGIRKKSNIDDTLERSCVEQSIISIRKADVVVLVLDATHGIEHQDLAIAGIANSEYKALIVLINKCDLLPEKSKDTRLADIVYRILHKISKDTVTINIAAINPGECKTVLDKCMKLYDLTNKKLSTGALNRWLHKALLAHNPPKLAHGKFTKLKYVTQIGRLPLSFVIFGNNVDIEEPYERYLAQSMKYDFGLQGIPIKFSFRKSDNPYENRKKSHR